MLFFQNVVLCKQDTKVTSTIGLLKLNIMLKWIINLYSHRYRDSQLPNLPKYDCISHKPILDLLPVISFLGEYRKRDGIQCWGLHCTAAVYWKEPVWAAQKDETRAENCRETCRGPH